MCEIFCYNSLKPKDVTAYLEKFFAGSEYHPHGWGLANLSPDYYGAYPLGYYGRNEAFKLPPLFKKRQ